MWDFVASLLGDPKRAAPLASALAVILLQVAAKQNWTFVDAHTADAVSTAIVALALGFVASHAHVEHAETHADALVEAAKASAKGV